MIALATNTAAKARMVHATPVSMGVCGSWGVDLPQAGARHGTGRGVPVWAEGVRRAGWDDAWHTGYPPWAEPQLSHRTAGVLVRAGEVRIVAAKPLRGGAVDVAVLAWCARFGKSLQSFAPSQ